MKDFDVVVIGAGPAGYTAAIRAAQLGLNVACIEREKDQDESPTLGGTCLNVGCIPSKALLESAHYYHKVKSDINEFGVIVDDVNLDLIQVMNRQQKIVNRLTSGIHLLFEKNGVHLISGEATVVSPHEISVNLSTNETIIVSAEHIILATGSSPRQIPNIAVDHRYILDSTDALKLTILPRKLGIIGAGVIGLELGSAWSCLGSDVTLFDSESTLFPTLDERSSKEALRLFKKQGLNFYFGVQVKRIEVIDQKVIICYESNGQVMEAMFDQVIVAIGRSPNVQNLIHESVGVSVDLKGFISVNDYCETNIPSIYAIGDIVRGPMLAHKGSEEGVMVVERLLGQKTKLNYDLIPSVVYTSPEIAWVGKTEKELTAQEIPYSVGMFSFSANGRTMASDKSADGFVKVIAHKETDRILGVQIIGNQASEIITQAVIAMEFSATAEDLILTVFAHPTRSEALHEACLSVHERAIHAINRKK